MPLVDSEEATRKGREGRMYTVSIKVKTEEIPSLMSPKEMAERRGKNQVAIRAGAALDFGDLTVVESQLRYTDPFAAREEWEVKVFRPYDRVL